MIAFSGHAITHRASLQPRHERAKLKSGVMRTTRILERIGFQMVSPLPIVQAYSQMPQPMHLPGSTEINFLCSLLLVDILLTKPFWYLDYCALLPFMHYLKKGVFSCKKCFSTIFIASFVVIQLFYSLCVEGVVDCPKMSHQILFQKS